MTTYILTGLVGSEKLARQICSMVERMTPLPVGTGFFELDEANSTWEIEAYFKEKPNISEIALLECLYSTNISINFLEKVDWVAKVQKSLTPISINNIYIHGSHHRGNLNLNKTNIEIQAAMAFGTGHHVTTRSCIHLFLALSRKGMKFRNIIDIGCGTGILSMVAAKTEGSIVTSVDNDLIAVDTTKANFSSNKIPSYHRVFRSNDFRNYRVATRGKFDLVFANILFLPLKNMVKRVASVIKRGGIIILSGMSHRQAIMVEKIYSNHTFQRVDILQEGPWTSLSLRYIGKNVKTYSKKKYVT